MKHQAVPKISSPSRSLWRRRITLLGHRASRLDPTVKGLLWFMAGGLVLAVLNTMLRVLTLTMNPLQAQFLRYLCAIVVMLPLIARSGVLAYRPHRMGAQFSRGAVHTVGLMLWFAALPKIPMADTTAIGFTQPIFIMLGAYFFFHETMKWERWLAAAIGFSGVLMVVGPKLSGNAGIYNLLMVASSPMFAASFLMTKSLTRSERAEVIVLWQAISVTAFSLPLALWYWQTPSAVQWIGFFVTGVLGTLGHYCITRAFTITDISSTQSVKFLDLVWAATLGWLVFAEIPSHSTLTGGFVISASTVWIAWRESRKRVR